MEILSVILLLSILILALVIICEVYAPGLVQEGFANLPKPSYWSNLVAPRSDIGPTQENLSYIRDPRYFADYTDVSRLGVAYDFCRMIAEKNDPTNFFFACALAGTEGLDSSKFRTASIKDGFRMSYDDYMRDINGDGRDDYCRILKWSDNSYQPVCQTATDFGFNNTEVIDSQPPTDIATLLTFYRGASVWLRFANDMLDFIGNVNVQNASGISLDESPKRVLTNGITFNGVDQFIRLSDSSSMSLGAKVPLKSIKTWMVWVNFYEFTNNAKIFDFGNGKANGNVFLGILGKGDPGTGDASQLRPSVCDSTVPTGPSGAQAVMEMSPKRLMETTDINVDEWTCQGFETYPRDIPRDKPDPNQAAAKNSKASLIYEVWDQQARKLRLKINSAISIGKWTHIVVTTTNTDAFRPNLAIYVNGENVLNQENGFLASTGTMTNCYLGKSNWSSGVSQYEDSDELFMGKMFDFRMYTNQVSKKFIADSYAWGKTHLGLEK